MKYYLVKQKNMKKGAPEDSTVVRPQLVSAGKVTYASLIKEIEKRSTLSSGDIKGCVDQLAEVIAEHLKNGQRVDAGDIGTFGIQLRSACADSAEEYSVKACMKTPAISYYPGKKLRDAREEVTYERVEPKTAECDKEHVEDSGDGYL